MTTFDEKISSAKSAAEIREICVAHQVASGVLTRERDGSLSLSSSVPAQPSAPAPAPTPTNDPRHQIERVIYPHDNARIVITATTPQELDEYERQVRAAFGK